MTSPGPHLCATPLKMRGHPRGKDRLDEQTTWSSRHVWARSCWWYRRCMPGRPVLPSPLVQAIGEHVRRSSGRRGRSALLRDTTSASTSTSAVLARPSTCPCRHTVTPGRKRLGASREIPYGRTTTYADLAERLGDASSAQAVGQAVGRNPLCVIVLCHRVVGSDDSLTGYAGGVRRKGSSSSSRSPPRWCPKLF